MLITNTILLVLYATLGASAPVLDGNRLQVEHHGDKSIYRYYPSDPAISTLDHPAVPGIFKMLKESHERMVEVTTAENMRRALIMALKGIKPTATTKPTTQRLVRRDNKAQQGGPGNIGLIKLAAKAIGIDSKSVSEYLANLRDDFPIDIKDKLPTCLGQAARQGLSAVETSLSGFPKCVSDNDNEIEISPDGIEVDADGLPTCLGKAGQDALKSIHDALNDLGDCAAATPSASTQG
ncbi:hypothetical protein N0V84_000332 [Fusarium piperis]|uniref:Uncharacterized protein n=1 Tax=Fusarium piperis TaxID=1435070 RepID=A0A9W8WNJ6_9HYPO|nr:hypothetical protein N0V84_000332 [Fusarium piperis]